MDIYVAGKYENRKNVRRLMTSIEFLGHGITEDWTRHEPDEDSVMLGYALDDVRGVRESDLFVLLVNKPYVYQGAFVELGVAISEDIPIAIIGHMIDGCIFSLIPESRFDTELEFLKWLEER